MDSFERGRGNPDGRTCEKRDDASSPMAAVASDAADPTAAVAEAKTPLVGSSGNCLLGLRPNGLEKPLAAAVGIGVGVATPLAAAAVVEVPLVELATANVTTFSPMCDVQLSQFNQI